ncbi:MAG: NAD-dependent epimerase/dehydratase family protein, partial [Candidatus Omnitrophica bacterium]|nr:NAD-dependent epimerase/dehydratase family protein [Candidatus Omnitrophota bacterium]
IGYHLAKKLLDLGNSIIGIDNMSNGRQSFVDELKRSPNFEFWEQDVYKINTIEFPFPCHKIDAVFHLAANSQINNPDPQIEIKDTFCTTYELLRFCRKNEIKEFVFASSGAIYGEAYLTEIAYVKENYGPLLPISHYGAAKLASEAFISSFASYYDIKAFICRLPNVIGSHATHGVILDFINKIKQNPKELEVLGDGSQTKPYMHVSDVVDAMVFIWQNAKEKVNYYNLAGKSTSSVKNIAVMVISAMRTNTSIRYTGGDRGWQGDSPRYYPSKAKLENLGWHTEKTSDQAVLTAIQEIIKENE